jgi:hypothetical protein
MDGEYARLVVFAILTVLWSWLRSWRLNKLLDTNQFNEIAWAIGGIVLTSGLLFKAINSAELRKIIGADGCLALLVGAGSQVLSSLGVGMKEDIAHLRKSIFNRKNRKLIP